MVSTIVCPAPVAPVVPVSVCVSAASATFSRPSPNGWSITGLSVVVSTSSASTETLTGFTASTVETLTWMIPLPCPTSAPAGSVTVQPP